MPKQYSRNRRVADLVQRELAVLIQREINDPGLGLITVSAVNVSPDLKNAKIFITSLGDRVDTTVVLESLNEMSGHFRHELSKVLPIRVTPKLTFAFDSSIERGRKLSALIDSLGEVKSEK